MENTVQLDKNEISKLFETAEHSTDIILALYKMVYGDRWDKISSINGCPTCNKSTALELMGKFIAFDKAKTTDQNYMLGGYWFNNGFSSCDKQASELANYEILPCEDLTLIA